MTLATAQFFSGTQDGKPAYLDYATGQTNLLPANKQKIRLNDIRNITPQPSIQINGFQKVDFTPAIQEHDFISADQASPSTQHAIRTYYKECEDLVSTITGASEIIAFHHRYRQQNPHVVDKVKSYTTTPVPDFHIDNDITTASAHLERVLGTHEASLWTSRRWAIINVWRPLDTVFQMPLALLDPASIPIHPSSLAEPVCTRSNYKSHIRGLRWHPEYRFCYVSEMEASEALLFVDYDSSRRWRMGGVAHGAVQEVMRRGDVPLRRSVEVRCLVLYE
ncbi:hypothetical protein N0V90_000950 [Kalmusia sp. IMI 367209]|nr:hypothetical protein N0V90_000950 [Kalmusia sp. IMI 367209]